MEDELVGFNWIVAEGGYRWAEAWPFRANAGDQQSATMQRFLIPHGPDGGLRYAPLHLYTGLFRTFADIVPTYEGVQAFANVYGLLEWPGGGSRVSRLVVLPETANVSPAPAAQHGTLEGPAVRGLIVDGEPIDAWLLELGAMRSAIQLWDAVHAKDFDTLARLIRWEGDTTVWYESFLEGVPPGRALIASTQIDPHILARFRPGDLIQPALYELQRTVNRRVDGLVSPRLLWEAEHGVLNWYVVPQSLLGAIWLQLAQSISERKSFRRCQECGRPFALDPDTARTSRLFCSNACRNRAYRRRKAEQSGTPAAATAD